MQVTGKAGTEANGHRAEGTSPDLSYPQPPSQPALSLQPHSHPPDTPPTYTVREKTTASTRNSRQEHTGSHTCPQGPTIPTNSAGLRCRRLDFWSHVLVARTGHSQHFGSADPCENPSKPGALLRNKAPAHTRSLAARSRTDAQATNSGSVVPQAGLKPGFAVQHLCVLRQVAPRPSVSSSVKWECRPPSVVTSR